MASVTTRPNGHRWVFFKHHEKRQTLRLGKVSRSFADEVKRHVEHLLVAEQTGEPLPMATARWLSDLPSVMRGKLSGCGLVSHEQRPDSLGSLLEYCLREYEDSKPNTQRNMARTANALRDRFGASCRLDSLTPGAAEDFRRWLRRQKLAETTVTELCRKAKRFFSMAKEHRWIVENPFGEMGGWVRTNPDRRHFVDRDTIAKLLKHCDPEWQLIVSLIRYGGVRAPSEVMPLRWEWINWAEDRMLIRQPKLEHLDGRAFRTCPIFPEVKSYLDEAFIRAENGAEHVVTRGRDRSDKWLYCMLRKRVIRAGIEPWPKLLINLRSSRETELAEQFPLHVVTSWLGHSPTIAQAHYLQVTEDHYRKAVPPSAGSAGGEAKSEAPFRGSCGSVGDVPRL